MSGTVTLPDLSQYGSRLAALVEHGSPSVLGGPPGEAVGEIEGLEPGAVLDGEVADPAAARAVLGGLLIWHHGHKQARPVLERLNTPEAACWMAISFRLEGDTGSANYWWHRAGRHPFFDPLTQAAVALLQGQEGPPAEFGERIARRGWDTGNFVELTRRVRDNIAGGAAWGPLLAEVQRAEMLLLLESCARKALGRT